ncbi:MAG: T9SS type A sorting domain-containing protein [Bacteroidia bacterium]
MFKNLFFSRRLNIAALFLAAFLFNLQSSVGQTSTQNFGTTTGSHTSGTGSSSFIPNPTSGTTYARGGATAPNAPVNLENTSNPLGTTGSFVRAVASSSTSVTKVSPAIAYTAGKEFYTSMKVLFGDASASNTANSGEWAFFQGDGAMYNNNSGFTGNQVFTGLRFTYASGVVNLDYRSGGSWSTSGLLTTSFNQGTTYIIEIVGNNKSSGTINYTYNGNPKSVAIDKFDLYINGTEVGDDLSKAQLTNNTDIKSTTFTGQSSASNVANLFLDDVVIYNSVPAVIGSGGSPVLSVGTLSNQFGNVCTGTTTAYETFTVSGANLDGSSVDVGTLSGFSYCLTPNGTYTSTLNLPYTAPTLNSTTVYVKFSPTLVQSYTGTIPVTGGSAAASGCSVTSAAGINTMPSLTTGAATGVTQNTATCEGTITDNGCTAVSAYGIEYSTTNNFTPGTGTQVSSSNISSNTYTSALSGLASSTTYYYRAYATNTAGTGYGAQASFTTDAINAPVAVAATNIGIHSFRANWNTVSGATGYFLDVSTASTFMAPITTDLVYWDFPNSPDDATADGGILANVSATISTQGGTSAITYSAGATTEAASATGWDGGNGTKYWEINFDATNYYSLAFSSKQRSSGTGPRDFKVQYKIGSGGTWTDVTGGAVTVGNDFTTGVLTDIALPTACDNQSSVYLRWIMTSNTSVGNGTVASTGTSRMDDLFVTGYEGDFVVNNQSEAGLFYDVTLLSPSTTYYYRVRATDGVLTSDNSNVINLTTLGVCDLFTVNASSDAPSPICSTTNINLTATASGSDGTITGYEWSGPGGYSNMTQNPTVVNPVSGTYTVTVTDDNGCTVTDNVSATVEAAPTANAGSDDIICSNGSASLNGSIGGDATGGNWTTTGDGTFSPNATTLNASYIPGTTDISNGSVVLTLTSTGSVLCSADNDQVTITIQTGVPSQPAVVIGAPTSVCPPAGPYTLTTSAANANTYNWYVVGANTGVTFLSANGSNSMDVQYGVTANSSYSVRVEASNACGTSAYRSAFTRRSVSTPASVSGNKVACASTSDTYSCTAVAGAESYQWSITGDATVIGTTNSVTVNFGPAWTGGTLCVAAKVGCFTSPLKCMSISSSTTALGTITGSVTACPNGVVGFSVVPVAGIQTYNWTTPANASVTSGIGTNSVQVTFNGSYNGVGNICVSATSICGVTTAPKCKTVAPGLPSVPASITGVTNGLCNTSSTFSTTQQASNTYNWTAPGTINNNGSNSVSIQFGVVVNGSSVCVSASNSCGTSAPRCVTIKGAPNSPVALTSNPATICANTSGVEFNANTSNTTGAYNLAWTFTPTAATYASGGGNTSQLILDWGTSNGTVVVTAHNACGSGAKSLPVNISCRMQGDAAKTVSMYPNPASNNVNVEFSTDKNETVKLIITDLSGKVVMQQAFNATVGNNTLQADISHLAKGIYMAQLSGSNLMSPQKLIVE